VFAVFHAQCHVARVVGGAGKDGHRVDLWVEDQFLQRLIGLFAVIRLHELLAALRDQVAHRFNGAVGVLVPVESAPKSAPHNANTDLLSRGVFPGGSGSGKLV